MLIYGLCGIPASGKSTIAKILMADKLYSFDELVKDYKGQNISKYHKQVEIQMFKDIQLCLKNNNSVICDHLLITKEKRLELLSYIPEGCKKICVVLNTPLEECLRRNAIREIILPDFVITQSVEIYEPPSIDEGWDEIIYVKEDETYGSSFTGD